MNEPKKKNLFAELLKAKNSKSLTNVMSLKLARKMGARDGDLKIRASRGGRNGNGKP